MKQYSKFISTILFCFLLLNCQTQSKNIPEVISDLLEINPAILEGKLDNGLSYFIQENAKPENRIELRLIINTGSIQENEEQKGLAHFVEHMAFNGTKNFEKDRLIKYLESLGMGFGPEINAYTSFDETVYQLSIPADDPTVLANAFQILEDWAHQISFEDEEIEKERGVIVEEWRGGRGVQGRYMDKLLPVLLQDSRYAERLTIGDMDVIKNCETHELRDYYNEWYRPELMAVAVVGNIESNNIESLIQKHFNFENNNKGRDRILYPVPILDRLDVIIMEDEEMTYTDLLYIIKKQGYKLKTIDDYKLYINELLTMFMFNSRMEEIYTKPDSPFLYAGSGNSSFVRNVSMFMFSAQLHDDKIEEGVSAVLSEVEKVKQNGFNQDELDRSKSLISMIMTNMYNERENSESSGLISEIVRYYLESVPVMDIGYENSIIKDILEQITLSEINSKSIDLFSGSDRTLTVNTPKDSSRSLPTDKSIKDLFIQISKNNFEKREVDEVIDVFFDKDLNPGNVINMTQDKELGITTLELNNGVIVVLKPTDFKSDQIAFSAVSYGGLSLVEDDEFYSGSFGPSLTRMSGLNGLDSIELDRFLTGKNVNVSPWIGAYSEGFSGGSNIVDKELMFQLLHLYFTNPEFSEDSYQVLITNVENYIANRNNSPNTIYSDKINEILGSAHFRSKPLSMDSLKDIDFEEIKAVYKERFNNPSDFYYIFTGNFEIDEMTLLVNKYLGSLSSTNEREEPKDLGIRYPRGIIEEVVVKGIEEKSRVQIIYSGDFNGTPEDEFTISLLSNYLEEELRVLVREELSGTYGVSVFSNIKLYPTKDYKIGISFGCEPGREEELSNAVFNELDKIRGGFINQEAVDAVIKNFLLNMELSLKDNGFWLSRLTSKTLLGRDYNSIIDTDTSAVTGDKFIELTKKYINKDNFVKIILKPEN
ncbi:MAG: insulinase family protein [Spirochaetaceae bacterium]